MKTARKLEELFAQYVNAGLAHQAAMDKFTEAIVFKGFDEYLDQPYIEEPYIGLNLYIDWGGKMMYDKEIIARMSEKGYLTPDDFLGNEEKASEQSKEEATDKKKYEKRNCVSVKWAHPENDKFYFSVGVSHYARGYGWSARASDGERYYWKRGHYYETDKKAAYFALSSLLDWLGKPSDRLGKCMRLAIWTNREGYDLRQMELFE